jgi:leucyl/phenylalanyl-tRNA--protein transferase
MATRPRDGLTRDERALVDATLSAYARGWFPMRDPETGVVHWVLPRKRGVIPLDERFRVSRSLRSIVRSGRFRITSDKAFGRVLRECAKLNKQRTETWISPEIVKLFDLLHRAGHAHSIEAWLDGPRGPVLVGGLYGLVIGSAFCGESMFSRPELGGSNASKVCLVHLVEHLRRQGFTMLDAQLTNPHLEQFGCFEIDQSDYAEQLYAAAGQAREWGELSPPETVSSSASPPPRPCKSPQSPRH